MPSPSHANSGSSSPPVPRAWKKDYLLMVCRTQRRRPFRAQAQLRICKVRWPSTAESSSLTSTWSEWANPASAGCLILRRWWRAGWTGLPVITEWLAAGWVGWSLPLRRGQYRQPAASGHPLRCWWDDRASALHTGWPTNWMRRRGGGYADRQLLRDSLPGVDLVIDCCDTYGAEFHCVGRRALLAQHSGLGVRGGTRRARYRCSGCPTPTAARCGRATCSCLEPAAGSDPSATRSECSGRRSQVGSRVMATEAIKLLAGFGAPRSGRVLVLDAAAGCWDVLPLRPRARPTPSVEEYLVKAC